MGRLVAALCGLGLTAALTRGARAQDLPESMTAEAAVDRRALPGGGTLVVSPEKTATTTVCAAPSRTALTAADAVAVARRGGRATVERVGDVRVRCVSVPAAELAFALGLARRGSGSSNDTEEPPEAPRERSVLELSELALEGVRATPESDAAWTLVVVGPATATEVAALAKAEPVTAVPVRSRPYTWSLRQESERLSVLEATLAVPAVRFGWAIPSPSPDDEAALSTAVRILGGGARSRATRVISERGLARHAESWSLRLRGGDLAGMWLELSSLVSADRVRRFADGIVRELRTVGPTRREVDGARAYLFRQELARWEDPETRSRALAWYEFAMGDASQWLHEIRGLSRVTPKSVAEVVKKTFVDARRTTVELYPPLWPTDDPAVSHATLYTVAKGDTLSELATRFRVTTAALARANDLDPNASLVPGEPLWVPSN